MEARHVLERDEDVPVQLDVRNVLDRAVCGERALLKLAAEERELDLLTLVLVGVVLHGGQRSRSRVARTVAGAASTPDSTLHHEPDDRLDVRHVPVGRVHVERRRREREAVEPRVRPLPVLDLVSDNSRVRGLPALDSEAPPLAPDRRVGMALNDSESSPSEEGPEPILPEEVLEGGLGDGRDARRDQGPEDVEEDRKCALCSGSPDAAWKPSPTAWTIPSLISSLQTAGQGPRARSCARGSSSPCEAGRSRRRGWAADLRHAPDGVSDDEHAVGERERDRHAVRHRSSGSPAACRRSARMTPPCVTTRTVSPSCRTAIAVVAATTRSASCSRVSPSWPISPASQRA